MPHRKLINRIKKIKVDKRLLIVACVLITCITVVSLWPVLLNKSYYSTNKDQAQSKLEKILSDLHPSSVQLLYTNIQDRGCDSNGVGLASYVTCSLITDKYFRTSDNPKSMIRQLNDQLAQQGFTSSTYSNDNNIPKTLAVPKGLQEGSAPYKSADKKEYLIFYVEFFNQGDTFTENYPIEKLINDGKLPYPSANDTYFGIQLQKIYWKCDSTSLLELYCPAPPSEPK